MARLHVSIYVETGLGERPLEYTLSKVSALDPNRDVDAVFAELYRMADDAIDQVRQTTHHIAREQRADNGGT